MKIIKFGTTHCGMCKIMDKILMNGNIPADIQIVDAEVNIDLANKYNVRSVPVIILFDNKMNEVHRWNGVVKENVIIETIKQYESKQLV